MSNYRCRYVRSKRKAFHLCHFIVGCFTSIKSKICLFSFTLCSLLHDKNSGSIKTIKANFNQDLKTRENTRKHEFQRIKDRLSSSTSLIPRWCDTKTPVKVVLLVAMLDQDENKNPSWEIPVQSKSNLNSVS